MGSPDREKTELIERLLRLLQAFLGISDYHGFTTIYRKPCCLFILQQKEKLRLSLCMVCCFSSAANHASVLDTNISCFLQDALIQSDKANAT